MRRFAGLCIGLILVFAAVIIAASLITRHRESPLQAMFTAPDGTACDQSCVFGIRPGVTNLDQAVDMLKKHPLTHDIRYVEGPGSRTGSAYVFASQNSVLTLYPDNNIIIQRVRLTYKPGYRPYSPSSIPLSPALQLESILQVATMGQVLSFAGLPGNQDLFCSLVRQKISCALGLYYMLYNSLPIYMQVDSIGQSIIRISPQTMINDFLFVASSDQYWLRPNDRIQWIGFTLAGSYIRQLQPSNTP
jgi:hypothetical protein